MNVDSDKLGSMAGLPPQGEASRPLPSGGFPFLQPAQAPGEIGRLGKYRVLQLLGKGGMAYVFLAEDVMLARRVALKVMKPDLDGELDAMPRFLREARLMASIKHPHLVTVYDVGQEPTVVWLAMELLEGESLETWLERPGAGTLPDILRIAREITSAVDAIHQKGLLHRDIKPGNIWLETPGARVKLLDFGLARHANDDARITQSGMVVGTPAYMSPEQARGEKLDARSDLFSLGCTLYCLCTGRKPFQGQNTLAVLTSLAVDAPAPVHVRNPEVPQPFSAMVMQLLEKKAENRPASAAVLLDQLNLCDQLFADTSGRPIMAIPVSDGSPSSLKTRAINVPSGPTAQQRLADKSWLRWAFPLAVGLLAGLVITIKLLVGAAVSPTISKAGSPSNAAGKPTEPLLAAGKTYLSDMKELVAVNWPMIGPPPPGVDGKVRIKGIVSPHGIFMHAPGGPAGLGQNTVSIAYRLGKQFRSFHAEVSLNDGPPGCDEMIFVVLGDGNELWKSKPVSRQADTQSCTIPVAGIDALEIEVRYQGSPMGAHAAWIEPHLLK